MPNVDWKAVVKKNRLDATRDGACGTKGEKFALDLQAINRSMAVHLDTERRFQVGSYSDPDQRRSANAWVLVENTLAGHTE
jgi:hypothetical protein